MHLRVVPALALLHAAATLFMVGLIWFVQIVHYPLFTYVATETFGAYEAAHVRRTTPVVMSAMLVELGTACSLLGLGRGTGFRRWSLVGALLLAVIWGSTDYLQVPYHHVLAEGFDSAAYVGLVATNWIRTIAWSARGALALWLVHLAYSKDRAFAS